MLHVGIVGCTACTSLINLNLRLHEDFVNPLEVILMAFRHQDYFASSCRLLSLFYSIFTSIPHDSLFVWAQCTWLQSHRKPYYRLTLSLAGRYCLGSLFLSCCCHQPGNTITMRSYGFAFDHLVSLWLQDLHNFRASKCVQFCILPSRLLLSLRDNISNLTSSLT